MMQRKVQKMKEEDEENVIAKSGEGVGTAEAFKDEVSTEAAELSRFFPPDSNTEQRRWSKRHYQKWTRSRNDIKASPSLILFASNSSLNVWIETRASACTF
jgi:hypothetical protein